MRCGNLKQARTRRPAAGRAAARHLLSATSHGAFAAAPVQLDVTYTTPLQSHAMMEPHATLAHVGWRQAHPAHREPDAEPGAGSAVATTLKIPVENVRLISPFIGGGFGGKLWVNADAILAAIAARKLEAPGEDRADPAAGVPRHDPPLRHHPARSSGDAIGTAASWRSATTSVSGNLRDRTALRGRGHRRPGRSMPAPTG